MVGKKLFFHTRMQFFNVVKRKKLSKKSHRPNIYRCVNSRGTHIIVYIIYSAVSPVYIDNI